MKKTFGTKFLLVFIFVSFVSVNIHSQYQWQQLPGLEGGNVQMLATNSLGDIFAATSSTGIVKSTNNGDTWLEKNNGLTTNNVISLAINTNDDIFAGTFNSGIFRSTDNGESWTQI